MSMKYFSDALQPYLYIFEDLKTDLIKADIGLSLKEYVSIAALTVSVVFIIEFPLLAFLVGLLPGFSIPMAFLFSFTMSVFLTMLLAFFFYVYPSIKVSNRAKKIDYSLPFVTTYLATVSGSNAPPGMMFKILSEFKEYEEVTKEANKLRRNIELLGMTPIEAMKKVAKQTPSNKFKELLWGITTTTRTGGDLTEYLHMKADSLMNDYRRSISQYSETLSTFLQIYLTLITVGSIFFIIISTIMGAFGLTDELSTIIAVSQFAVIFLLLPGISLGFIQLLSSISPQD